MMETPRIVDNFYPSFDAAFPPPSSSPSDLALFAPDVFDDLGIPRLEADDLSVFLSSPPQSCGSLSGEERGNSAHNGHNGANNDCDRDSDYSSNESADGQPLSHRPSDFLAASTSAAEAQLDFVNSFVDSEFLNHSFDGGGGDAAATAASDAAATAASDAAATAASLDHSFNSESIHSNAESNVVVIDDDFVDDFLANSLDDNNYFSSGAMMNANPADSAFQQLHPQQRQHFQKSMIKSDVLFSAIRQCDLPLASLNGVVDDMKNEPFSPCPSNHSSHSSTASFVDPRDYSSMPVLGEIASGGSSSSPSFPFLSESQALRVTLPANGVDPASSSTVSDGTTTPVVAAEVANVPSTAPPSLVVVGNDGQVRYILNDPSAASTLKVEPGFGNASSPAPKILLPKLDPGPAERSPAASQSTAKMTNGKRKFNHVSSPGNGKKKPTRQQQQQQQQQPLVIGIGVNLVTVPAVAAVPSATTVPSVAFRGIDVSKFDDDGCSLVDGGEGDADQIRQMRKQQRLIKNRESALISRQKKKEYMSTLEERLKQAQEENMRLQFENASLKSQLSSLSNENRKLMKQPPSSHNGKKAATLFLFTFLLTLNLGPWLPWTNKSTSPKRYALTENIPSEPAEWRGWASGGGNQRRLLSDFSSSSSEDSFAPTTRDDFNSTRAEAPSANVTFSASASSSRPKVSVVDELCSGALFNSTESIRLAAELKVWVESLSEARSKSRSSSSSTSSEEKVTMMKKKKKKSGGKEEGLSLLVSPRPAPAPPGEIPSTPRNRKFKTNRMDLERLKFEAEAATKRYRNYEARRNGADFRNFNDAASNVAAAPPSTHLVVYDHSGTRRRRESAQDFFDSIGAKNDSFYLVSFHKDYLLYQPHMFNKTSRIKMSFMVPTVLPLNHSMRGPNGSLPMMQIDCEVLNMSLIHLTKESVPDYLRNNDTFGDGSDGEFPSTLRPSDVVVRSGVSKKLKAKRSARNKRQQSQLRQP